MQSCGCCRMRPPMQPAHLSTWRVADDLGGLTKKGGLGPLGTACAKSQLRKTASTLRPAQYQNTYFMPTEMPFKCAPAQQRGAPAAGSEPLVSVLEAS